MDKTNELITMGESTYLVTTTGDGSVYINHFPDVGEKRVPTSLAPFGTIDEAMDYITRHRIRWETPKATVGTNSQAGLATHARAG